ncbi:18429_t:CDS:2, partial [Dentiscutata erythropus]
SYCKVVGIDFLRPILEIETRWNSVLDMFERYIILHPAIKEMQLKETSMPSCLEMDELLELELTCKILKPFAIATTILSKDHKISDHVLIAHILDPRYKMEHLKATLLEIGGYSESKAEQYINNIRQKILSYETNYTSLNSSILEIECKDYIKHNEFFLKGELQKNILDLYEREPLENFENESNEIETNVENSGLHSWKLLSNRFPILSQIACDFLSIQPSSVASERAFSRAGFTVTKDRANLNENTVSSTILMHSWLKESQKKSSPLENLPETK